MMGNVKGHLFVAVRTVHLVPLTYHQIWIAVRRYAARTLTAATKNATLMLTIVVLTPIAFIGLSAARVHHVPMEREIVTMMGNVTALLFVAIMSVEVDHQIWTVV